MNGVYVIAEMSDVHKGSCYYEIRACDIDICYISPVLTKGSFL